MVIGTTTCGVLGLKTMTAHSPKPHRPPYPRRYITPVESSTEETPKKHESRFGSPLLGSANDTPKKTRTRIFLLLWALLSGAHLSGALACLLIISSIVPSDRIFACLLYTSPSPRD